MGRVLGFETNRPEALVGGPVYLDYTATKPGITTVRLVAEGSRVRFWRDVLLLRES